MTLCNLSGSKIFTEMKTKPEPESIFFLVNNAKRDETMKKRVGEAVAMLRVGRRLGLK